jgi:hypothetical protein
MIAAMHRGKKAGGGGDEKTKGEESKGKESKE